MRRKLPIEKIHVRELCRKAMINKSTFYYYYEDINALVCELEDETIMAFLDKFLEKNYLITNPTLFLTKMPITFDENMKLLDPIFRDNYDKAFNKLEKQLKNYMIMVICQKKMI